MTAATRGALAGLMATGPMTYAQMSFFNALPEDEKSPIPPATITDDVFKKLGIRLGDSAIVPATMAAHYGYGVATAIPYSIYLSDVPLPNVVKGSLYGFAVWAASYAGLHPMLGLRSQVSNMPLRRNLMMIAAHFVWGTSVAYADDLLKTRPDDMLVGERKKRKAE